MSGNFRRALSAMALLCAITGAMPGAPQSAVPSPPDSASATEERAATLSRSNRPEDWNAAISAYNESLQPMLDSGDRSGQGRVHTALGRLYDRTGQPAKARDSFTAALAALSPDGDLRTRATALYGLGKVQAAMHQTPEALAAFQQSLALRRQTGDLFEQALILHNMAAAQWAVADNAAALENYRQALALRQEIDDKPGLAYTHYGIGMVHWSAGERQFALDSCEQSRKLWEELDNPFGLANVTNSMGLLYAELGDLPRARDTYAKALSLWRRAQSPVMQAYTENNLGMADASEGHFHAASTRYESALSALRLAGDQRGIAYVLHNQGDLALLRNKPQEALALYESSLGAKRGIGDRYGEAITLERMAEAQRRLGSHQSAEEGFRIALARHREVGNLSGQTMAHWGLARVRLAQHNPPGALQHFQEAIDLSEHARGALSNEDLRVTYFATVQDLYQEAIEAAAAQYRLTGATEWAETAFLLAERSRARALLDTLAASHPDTSPATDPAANPSAIATLRRLQGRMRATSQRLQRLSSASGNPQQLAHARAQLQTLVQEWRDMGSASSTANPIHRWSPPADLLAQIRSSALDPQTTLLVFRLGESESYAWTVSNNTLAMHTLPGRKVVERYVQRYLSLIRAREPADENTTLESRRSQIQAADDSLSEAALQLSWLLLSQPLRDCAASRLVLVPDGALHALPIAALPQPYHPAEPLLARWQITRTPSASVLAALRQRPPTKPEDRVVAIADPVYGPGDTRLGGNPAPLPTTSSTEGDARTSQSHPLLPTLPRLRFTRQEAAAIESTAGMPVEVFEGFNATRELFSTPRLRTARILHIGAHAWVDTRSPAASGIALSLFTPDGRPRDGYLRLFDLYETSVRADLVVLGGCRTALGKTWEGEGVDGLVRGFLHAGASRVVATLWTVNDAASAELLSSFYRHHLALRKPAGAALRAAQRELAQSNHFAHPYYWAAFVLVGE